MVDLSLTNAAARTNMKWLFGNLIASIQQALANSPPIAVAPEPQVRETSWGVGVGRVWLSDAGSSDIDSTPGTTDNIRAYRWYDDRGNLLHEGREWTAFLPYDRETGITVHPITLEVEDAYGARTSATTTVTVVAGAP